MKFLLQLFVHGLQERERIVNNMAKPHTLALHSKVYSFAIKCYEDQMPFGLEHVINAIKNVDSRIYHILAILHYRDLVTDGIWALAYEKPHIHIIIRCVDTKKRVRVSTIMNMLGIYFRPGVDDLLWKNRGVETVGKFSEYAVYLTHETPQAISDGKELYDITEIISNLSPDEIERVREGYVRVKESAKKVSQDELVALDKEAFDMGYNMKNFDEWYMSQPFQVRSNAKMKTIRESYDMGIHKRVEEQSEVLRLCVFIQGASNTGKTYASTHAFDGYRVLHVGGGRTGKFDRLRPDHEVIIVDDDTCPSLLNMTDNTICYAYKRNKGNPPWSGQYFIVTSNLSFEEWLEASGIKTRKNINGYNAPYTEHYNAMLSRFFVCRLERDENGVNHLACTSVSTRGDVYEQLERGKMFMDFKERFDNIISTYVPSDNYVDFGSILEPRKD